MHITRIARITIIQKGKEIDGKPVIFYLICFFTGIIPTFASKFYYHIRKEQGTIIINF